MAMVAYSNTDGDSRSSRNANDRKKIERLNDKTAARLFDNWQDREVTIANSQAATNRRNAWFSRLGF